MSLEFLIEDCVDSNFNEGLPAKRRNDILAELKNKDLVPILDRSYAVLSQCFGSLQALPPGQSSDIEPLTTAMNCVLGMLGPLALLAKPSDMTEPARNFVDVAVLLLSVEPLKGRALELLSRVARAGQVLSREAFGSLLHSLSPVLGAVYASAPPSSTALDGHIYYGIMAGRVDVDGMDDLEHSKRLIEAATIALTSSIELLADRRDSDTLEAAQERPLQVSRVWNCVSVDLVLHSNHIPIFATERFIWRHWLEQLCTYHLGGSILMSSSTGTNC